jgi:hypothetical protein
MLLYLFYSADLVDCVQQAHRRRKPSKGLIAWVDDTTVLAEAKMLSQAADMLRDIMEREGRAFKWSRTHNSNFDVPKYAYVGFSRRRKTAAGSKKLQPETRPDILLRRRVIRATTLAKLLGVILDQELRWK